MGEDEPGEKSSVGREGRLVVPERVSPELTAERELAQSPLRQARAADMRLALRIEKENALANRDLPLDKYRDLPPPKISDALRAILERAAIERKR
jgi:hypothetical protein